MTSLIPCTACRRHVRRHEVQCRFCGAQLNPSGALLREILIPRDAKRATIFAIGMTLAGQACGGESAIAIDGAPPTGTGAANGDGGSGDRITPVYGAPTAPGAGGSAGAPNGMGGSNNGGNGNGGSGPQPVPVYGAPVPPEAAGSSGMPDASALRDAGGDAATDDAGD